MKWLSIDFASTLSQISPTFFRGEEFDSFNNATASTLQTLADKTLYEMQHDSTVISLEKMLNEYFSSEFDTYDATSHLSTRQVFIEDASRIPPTYIYQTAENQPVYLGSIYLDRTETETADFIVKIPVSFSFNEARLRQQIDFYKLAGKQYRIETY